MLPLIEKENHMMLHKYGRIMAVLLIVALFAITLLPQANAADGARRRGGVIELTGTVIKGKAWRPEFGEVASWAKEKMRSDRLLKKESFIPRIKKSVRKSPF